MATYATDLQTFDLCQTGGNFSELDGHKSGAAPAATSENYWQDGSGVDQATGQALNQTAGMECDVGSAVTWTGTSNWVFLMSNKFDAGTNIYSWSTGGLRIGIGSSSGNIKFWNAMGDDFRSYPKGGWQYNAIDPEATADAIEGTPVAGSYQVVGSLPNMRAKITKGSPHCIDAIRYGRGELQVTGTSADFDGMSVASEASTAKWGLFDGSEWQGLMSLGLIATSVTFSDSNKSFRVVDNPRVKAGFNKIEINNANSSVTWDTVSIEGVALSITGSAPISKGDFEVVDNATVSKADCTFTNLGTFIYQSNSTLINIVFRGCGIVTQGGASITGSTFDRAAGTTAVSATTLNNLDACIFTSSGTGYAVDMSGTAISASTSMGWDNTSSGYTDTSGNRTIRAQVNDTAILTIYNNTSDTLYVENSGTSTAGANGNGIEIKVAAKTLSVNVKDQTPTALSGAHVYLDEDYGVVGNILNTTTDVNGDASVLYSGTSPTVGVRIRKYGYKPYSGTLDSSQSSSVNVTLITDPQQS